MKILKLSEDAGIKYDGENYMLFDNLTGNIYKLNELSYKILSLCDGENTDEDIISNITNDFDVSEEEAKKDFNGLIRILLDKKYIYCDNNTKKRR
ncbi:MAG: PqqD family protein [bacterium]